MFGNSVHKLPLISNYERAQKFFARTPKPPRSKKWAEHQRPLKDVSSPHYRIERHNDGEYYDLVNYNTTLARFHKPDAEGNQLREYVWYDSTTSRDFLNHVANVYAFNERTTTTGVKRIMPIAGKPLPDSQFSCRAWFTPSGVLMADKSEHTRLYRRVSSANDRAMRATLKKKFEPLLTIAAMRIPEMIVDVDFDFYTAGAFRSRSIRYATLSQVRALRDRFEAGQDPLPEDINAFMSVAKDVFDKIASDRAMAKNLLNWNLVVHDNNLYEKIDPIDERTYTNALWKKLMSVLELNTTSGYQQYPQFPEPHEIVLSNCTSAGPK